MHPAIKRNRDITGPDAKQRSFETINDIVSIRT